MKPELELNLTESIRLFEAMTGKTIRQLRWSSDLRVATVVVGSPAARVSKESFTIPTDEL